MRDATDIRTNVADTSDSTTTIGTETVEVTVTSRWAIRLDALIVIIALLVGAGTIRVHNTLHTDVIFGSTTFLIRTTFGSTYHVRYTPRIATTCRATFHGFDTNTTLTLVTAHAIAICQALVTLVSLTNVFIRRTSCRYILVIVWTLNTSVACTVRFRWI